MILRLRLGTSSLLISLLPSPKKVCTVLGPEFGSDAGKSAIIVRALSGQKSAGGVFHVHLASFMHQVGYTSCRADPDLWFKAETRPAKNFRCCAYIYFIMLMKFYVYTMTLRLSLIKSMDICHWSNLWLVTLTFSLAQSWERTNLQMESGHGALALLTMLHKLSKIVKNIWPTNSTIIINYPHELTTHFLMAIALYTPLQPPWHRVLVILSTPYWYDEVDGWAWPGWHCIWSYCLTLRILARDTLRRVSM